MGTFYGHQRLFCPRQHRQIQHIHAVTHKLVALLVAICASLLAFLSKEVIDIAFTNTYFECIYVRLNQDFLQIQFECLGETESSFISSAQTDLEDGVLGTLEAVLCLQLCAANLEHLVVDGSLAFCQGVSEGAFCLDVLGSQLRDEAALHNVILEDAVAKGDVRRCGIDIDNEVGLLFQCLQITHIVFGKGVEPVLTARLSLEVYHCVQGTYGIFFIDAEVIGLIEHYPFQSGAVFIVSRLYGQVIEILVFGVLLAFHLTGRRTGIYGHTPAVGGYRVVLVEYDVGGNADGVPRLQSLTRYKLELHETLTHMGGVVHWQHSSIHLPWVQSRLGVDGRECPKRLLLHHVNTCRQIDIDKHGVTQIQSVLIGSRILLYIPRHIGKAVHS